MADDTERVAAFRPPRWQVEPRRDVILPDGQTIVLRPVAPTDADLMATFFATLTEREIYYFFSLDEASARRLATEVDSDPAYRLIAVDESCSPPRVTGYMFLHWRGSDPPGYGVCLLPDVQSGGLGRTMLDHLLTSAARSGVERSRLTVHTDNWRALRLYQRSGFVVVDDFISPHQDVKQYRMEVDLRAERPRLTEDVTIVPRGGLGVARAAGLVQRAIEVATGLRPLVIDRPARPGSRVIFVADLGPGVVAAPSPHPGLDWGSRRAWFTSLDDTHLLIAGTDPDSLTIAAERYAGVITASGHDHPTVAVDDLPLAGQSWHQIMPVAPHG